MRATMPALRRDTYRIAGHIGVDPRTVEKALRGGSVLPVVRAAVEAAARELNIALPTQRGA